MVFVCLLSGLSASQPTDHKVVVNSKIFITICNKYRTQKGPKQPVNIEFLGLQIHNHLNWQTNVDQMSSKITGAFYTVSE
jgi:hypothetical protein